MGRPKLSPDVLKLSARYPAGVLGNPKPIAQRFAHTADLRQSALRAAEPPRASPSEEPRAAAREATLSAEGGLAARSRWLIAGLIIAALVPSLILGALWLGLVSTSWSTPAASPSEPQSMAPPAVLTAPDRIEAIAGEDVSFPIALDGTDGVPSRSVIAVRGLPQDSNFSEGRPYGDSEWTLKPDQIGDLDLVLPSSANGEFKLGIVLIAPDDKVIAEAETVLEIAPAPVPAAPATEAGSGPEPGPSEATAVAAVADGRDAAASTVAPDAGPDEKPATTEVDSATDPSGAAPAAAVEPTEQNKSGLGTVQPSVFVNLREGPSSSASVVGVIAKGATLSVLDRKRGWVQVTDPETGKKGWIYRGNLAGEAKTHHRARRVAPAEAEPKSDSKSESFWGTVGRWLTPS